jgi:hypothetical protein
MAEKGINYLLFQAVERDAIATLGKRSLITGQSTARFMNRYLVCFKSFLRAIALTLKNSQIPTNFYWQGFQYIIYLE